MQIHETHPLSPFFPRGATALMLGSFPPEKKRWKMNFFYPNLQNDMWRIFGLVFFDDRNHFLTGDLSAFDEQAIRNFLTAQGIALWDTAMEVERQHGNASDKFLEVIRPIDLDEVLRRLPACTTIIITGQKAMDTLLPLVKCTEPDVGCYTDTVYRRRALRIYRMPSSSRAYPKPVTEKAAIYAKMFRELGIGIV